MAKCKIRKDKATGYTSGIPVINMMAHGKMTYLMGKERNIIPINPITKALGKMVRDMGREPLLIIAETCIKDNGLMIRNMVMASKEW